MQLLRYRSKRPARLSRMQGSRSTSVDLQALQSKHWIDHKLVTPINSERSVQCKTSSVEASRRASPPGLRVIKTNRRPGIRVDRVQGSRETMSIANNIDYGGAFSLPCAAGAAPSELEVMLMSTVSAVPQGDESFEQGGQRGVKKHVSSQYETSVRAFCKAS